MDELLIKINEKSPSSFENIESNQNELLVSTLGYIIKRYNTCLANNLTIEDEFKKVSQAAGLKKVKYGSVFSLIGSKLSKGEELKLVEIYQASNYYK